MIDKVPANDAEFVRDYRAFVVNLCRLGGISEDNKEDVAHDIMYALLRRDILGMYDPNYVSEYNGELRPARFKSFLASQVSLYLRSHREKQQKRNHRELQILDAPLTDHTGHSDGADSSFVDHLAVDTSPEGNPLQRLLDVEAEADCVAEMRAILGTHASNAKLVGVFDQLVAHVRDRDYVDIPSLEGWFGVSSTSMHTWLWELVRVLEVYVDAKPKAKRARTVRV